MTGDVAGFIAFDCATRGKGTRIFEIDKTGKPS
jgi:hypothetical protein